MINCRGLAKSSLCGYLLPKISSKSQRPGCINWVKISPKFHLGKGQRASQVPQDRGCKEVYAADLGTSGETKLPEK